MSPTEARVIQFLVNNSGKPEGMTWLDVANKFNVKVKLDDRRRSETVREWDRKRRRNQQHKVVKSTVEYGRRPKPVTHKIKKDGAYVVLGCVHVPFHDKELFSATLKLINNSSINGLILLGDFLDLNTLSQYDRGKLPTPGIDLGYEYDEGNKAIDELENVLSSDCEKIYLYGNHEHRYFKFISDATNSKLKGGVKTPTEALKLKKRRFTVLEHWEQDEIIIGDITAIHGTFCGTYPAKKHLDVFKRSIMFAHTHRINSHLEGNFHAYNIGWMGDVYTSAFDYASKSQRATWSQGFAVVNVKDGTSTVQQIVYNKDDKSLSFGNEKFYAS